MKFWIVVSLLAHTALGWLLYDRMMMPPKVPLDTSLMVNLVQIAPPPPRVQPAKQPEAPKPEKAEQVKAEPPKPKPEKPEPVVSKKTASPLEKLLAKVKKQKEKRDRNDSREKPTPTPRSLVQSVPTIKPLAIPTVQVAQADSRQQDDQRSPVAIDIPQGLYKI